MRSVLGSITAAIKKIRFNDKRGEVNQGSCEIRLKLMKELFRSIGRLARATKKQRKEFHVNAFGDNSTVLCCLSSTLVYRFHKVVILERVWRRVNCEG